MFGVDAAIGTWNPAAMGTAACFMHEFMLAYGLCAYNTFYDCPCTYYGMTPGQKSKIDFIIFPEWSRSKNYDFFEIKKSVSLKKILQSSFFSYADFNQEDFFKMNVCLTEGVRCFQFKRYKDFFSFKYLDEFISKI